MVDLFEKCYTGRSARAKQAIEEGWYPYFIPIESGADSTVVISGEKKIMIGSNNYLGLTQDPRVIKAAKDAIDKFGTGCTGSRFLNGTLTLHEELEERLADFMGKEAALVFSTGFQTNQGVISTLVGRKDLVIGDAENHASIVDGTRLSFGRSLKFRHDDMDDLEKVLQRNNTQGGILIVTDGVFSMGGDIANLPRIVELAEKYSARVMVDDAHAVGVLGATGAGTAEHYGLTDKVDLVMSTFSKSFASLGGFVAGDKDVIHHIKHTARALIFSASPPPSAVATVLACLDILQQEPERLEMLQKNTQKMLKGYKELGFNTGNSETPIIPIIIGDDEKAIQFWRLLYDNGVVCNPVVNPAVPPDGALLRTSYMATHTEEQLDRVLEIFAEVGKKFGII